MSNLPLGIAEILIYWIVARGNLDWESLFPFSLAVGFSDASECGYTMLDLPLLSFDDTDCFLTVRAACVDGYNSWTNY